MDDDASFLKECGIEVDRDWLLVMWFQCRRHPQRIPNARDVQRISEIAPFS
jgi:hypothetical protein